MFSFLRCAAPAAIISIRLGSVFRAQPRALKYWQHALTRARTLSSYQGHTPPPSFPHVVAVAVQDEQQLIKKKSLERSPGLSLTPYMFTMGACRSTTDRITNLEPFLPVNKAMIKMGLDDMGECLAQRQNTYKRAKRGLGGKKTPPGPDWCEHGADIRCSVASPTETCQHCRICSWTGNRLIFVSLFLIHNWRLASLAHSATLGIPSAHVSSSKTFPWICSKEQRAVCLRLYSNHFWM